MTTVLRHRRREAPTPDDRHGVARDAGMPTIAATCISIYRRRVRYGPQGGARRRHSTSTVEQWPARAALFVGHDGDRITRCTVQYRVERASVKLASAANVPREPSCMARATSFATELARDGVSVYALMSLLGHESLSTSQRYVQAAGIETRRAAARNPIYRLLPPTNGGQLAPPPED